MSFNHMMVSEFTEPDSRDLHNQEQSVDWPWKLDGIPVRKEVYDLGNEMRRSFKGYCFHASRRCNNRIIQVQFKDDVVKQAYADVQVYIEGSDYVVGRIGFGKKYGIREADKSTYMIHSRKIENEKFAEHRDQYHMTFVTDLKKALKMALTKLTPYSPKEMADLSFHTFKHNLEGARGQVKDKLINMLSPLQGREVLLTEVRNLIAQGVSFTTPQFIEAAEQIVQAEREWEAVRHKPMHGYYVYVRMVGDEQWVDVIDAVDMQRRHGVHDCTHTSFPVSDLPEDIQGKIAVLAMAEVGQYMQGVGRHVSTKAFWIERDV